MKITDIIKQAISDIDVNEKGYTRTDDRILNVIYQLCRIIDELEGEIQQLRLEFWEKK